MTRFKKQWDKSYKGTPHREKNNLPSKTVPDQSMSVAEIMQRFASGLPVGGQKVPVYEGEEHDYPLNWEKMDISERHDFVKNNLQMIKELQNELNTNAREAEKIKIKQEAEKAIKSAKPDVPGQSNES